MGCSRGVPGLFRAVPGCSGGVPGVFRGVPGMFRGVPGCSGFYRHPNNFRLFASQIDQSMFTFVTFPRYKAIFSSRVYLESQPTAE